MKRVTERLALMSLDAADMLLERGVEVINVCDDLGNAEGLLISPQLFREFFLPWYERLADLVHGKGAYLHLHSHGNISPVLADLVGIGIGTDIINPFDWDENPDLPGLVDKYGDRLIFCGGVTGGMHRCSLEEVEHIVNRACALAARAEKGYVLMTGGPTEDVSPADWGRWRDIVARARERSR